VSCGGAEHWPPRTGSFVACRPRNARSVLPDRHRPMVSAVASSQIRADGR
jgi:hypothetical protein